MGLVNQSKRGREQTGAVLDSGLGRHGLQAELPNPVAVLCWVKGLNCSPSRNEAGFRCFTSVDATKAYVARLEKMLLMRLRPAN